MPRAEATCFKCKNSLKGHLQKKICPSEHRHLLTVDNKYTCSYKTCNKVFTTLYSAHKHSITICSENKKSVIEYPCPSGCELMFRHKTNALEHAKSMACPKNPERITHPKYKSIIYHEIKDGKKYCNGCKILKDISFFGLSKTSKTKLAYTCCTCYAAHAMYQNCRKRAIKEGHTPDFILEDIQLLAKNTLICPIFGYTLQYGGDKFADNSATIDAYIHTIGHKKENLCIISSKANTIKNNANIDDMKLLLDALSSWKSPIIESIPKNKKTHTILLKTQINKKCSVCKIDKPLNEYSNDLSNKTLGKCSRCFRCSAIKAMYSNSKNRVFKKEIPFTITIDYLYGLSKDIDICPILKIPLQYAGSGRISDNSASLDRFDPLKGYIPGNVWIISDKANRMKSNATYEEIKKVYQYMIEAPTPLSSTLSIIE